MAIYYIGAFPPEYGGVTIKNQNLYEALKQKIDICKVDLNRVKRHDLREILRLATVMVNPQNSFVLGPSGQRRALTKFLFTVNRRAMRHSVITLMGGTAAKSIVADSEFCRWSSNYKKIYVETQGMLKQLEQGGLTNGAIYPNCRFRPCLEDKQMVAENQNLECVFFSQISQFKGADIVLEAARELKTVNFTFYGAILDEYKDNFLEEVESLPNVQYKGIFKGAPNDIYIELGKYDVMLFPSKWKHEGVPGIIVESKIAGITAIVSDIAFNAELVEDEAEGIVLKDNTVTNLVEAISRLSNDRELLARLKKGSHKSCETFYVENYVQSIVEMLQK